jgi:hypothetical protein
MNLSSEFAGPSVGVTLNITASYKSRKCGAHSPPVYGFDTFTGELDPLTRAVPKRQVEGCSRMPGKARPAPLSTSITTVRTDGRCNGFLADLRHCRAFPCWAVRTWNQLLREYQGRLERDERTWCCQAGLPETWAGFGAGHFSMHGSLPAVVDNARLVKVSRECRLGLRPP